jgi:hypothetical protein
MDGALTELRKCIESLDATVIDRHFESLGSVIHETFEDRVISDASSADMKSQLVTTSTEKFSGTLARIVKMLEALGASSDEVADVRNLWPGEMDKPNLFVDFFNKVIEVIRTKKRNLENSMTSYLYCRFQASLLPYSVDFQFRDAVHDVLQKASQLSIPPDVYNYLDFHSCLTR